MENTNAVLDTTWLDESFAKGLVDELEAARCLAGCSQEEAKIKKLFPITKHWSDIITPLVSKLYEIITTWPNLTGKQPLLWYIEQAIKSNTPYVRYDLLCEKCKEGEYRQKEILDKYPGLAQKLGLIAASNINKAIEDQPSITNDELENESHEPPKDRNNRLFERGVVIAIEKFKPNDKISLKVIHHEIIKEEKGKSDISAALLRRHVKLKDIKREYKKRHPQKL